MLSASMDDWIILLSRIATWIWAPLLVILVGTGLFLTYRLRGLQFRYLWYSLKLAFTRHDDDAQGDISHFQALMTALAATIGIGNIAGVATAVSVGGLGAIFWLWITALIGMVTKYSEAVLAIKYRIKDDRGEMAGGPMYFLERGLGWKGMALMFAFSGAFTTFFIGNIVQSNSIASALSVSLGFVPWITGIVLAVLTALVLIGGIKSIGGVTSYLVPIMALFYTVGCLLIIILRYSEIPTAIALIFSSAFTGQAAAGGFAGSTIMLAIQMGVRRGVFSNESGLGSSPIAAAAAKTDLPSRQALVSMTGAFLSTVLCTFTGLALAVTHVIGRVRPDGGLLSGAPLTIAAFDAVLPYGGMIVVFGSLLFGFSTIIGWAYYGEKCCEYIFGTRSILYYRLIFSIAVFIGVLVPIDAVWFIADITNAFMALPNLLGLFALSGVVVVETRIFFDHVRKEGVK